VTARRLIEALLAGIGQILLSSRPATGLLLLAAIAVVAPLHAAAALVGAGAATACAAASGWNRLLLRDGLFGFNGAVMGVAWPEIFEPTSPGFWLLAPAAVGATRLQGRLLPPFTRRDLPVLGVPFLLIAWAFAWAGAVAGWRRALTDPPPRIGGPLAGWSDPALLAEIASSALRYLPAILLGLIAAWLASRVIFGAALLGTAAGLVASLLLGGAGGLLWAGAVAYNAVPAAIGLAAVFFPPGAASLAAAAAGAGLAALLWALATPPLLAAGLFPLTAPMHAVILGSLLLPRPRATWPADAAALSGLLRRSSRVLVLSGAGMSTESGIPDYRTHVGFWYDANAEDLVYRRFLESERSRRLYWRLQRRFMAVLERSAPNAGHRALARLEASGRLLGIITQNVDGLHQAAGCPPARVVELHGSARWVVCVGCGRRASYAEVARDLNGTAPPCGACGGLLKTETVSFGEPLDPARLARALQWCEAADLLLVLGTSLQVEPAASLPEIVRSRGRPVVVVNRTPTPWDRSASLVLRSDVGATLEAAVGDLGGRRIRPLTRADFDYLCRVADAWWGDTVRYLLHPVYLEHFGDTAFVLEDERGLAGFLLGFVSQRHPDVGYVHMIGVAPDRRGEGIGRSLYEHFFALARARGCRRVAAITVPANAGSLAFHRRLGFALCSSGAAWEGDVPVVPDYAGPGVSCVVMERAL
jgi:NAD-dependent deacetylase